MNTAIINLLDRELPQLRGAERDELAAKIAALVSREVIRTQTGGCPCSCHRKRGRK